MSVPYRAPARAAVTSQAGGIDIGTGTGGHNLIGNIGTGTGTGACSGPTDGRTGGAS